MHIYFTCVHVIIAYMHACVRSIKDIQAIYVCICVCVCVFVACIYICWHDHICKPSYIYEYCIHGLLHVDHIYKTKELPCPSCMSRTPMLQCVTSA